MMILQPVEPSQKKTARPTGIPGVRADHIKFIIKSRKCLHETGLFFLLNGLLTEPARPPQDPGLATGIPVASPGGLAVFLHVNTSARHATGL